MLSSLLRSYWPAAVFQLKRPSYDQLLPIWMALGWLTVWPAICQSRPVEPQSIRDAVVRIVALNDSDRVAAERGKGITPWEPSLDGDANPAVLAGSGRPLQRPRWRDQ